MTVDIVRAWKDPEYRKSLTPEEMASLRIRIVRAWKDPEYRKSLTSEELASLPPNPAGDSELLAQDLAKVSGGGTVATKTCGGCTDHFPTYYCDPYSPVFRDCGPSTQNPKCL
jgi:mersacidin/lichenicidin family type 2 lantibiotic